MITPHKIQLIITIKLAEVEAPTLDNPPPIISFNASGLTMIPPYIGLYTSNNPDNSKFTWYYYESESKLILVVNNMLVVPNKTEGVVTLINMYEKKTGDYEKYKKIKNQQESNIKNKYTDINISIVCLHRSSSL